MYYINVILSKFDIKSYMKQSFSSPDINISVKIRTPKINLELMISYKNTSVFDQHDMNSLIIPVQVCRKI